MWLFCYRLIEERRERINNFLSELMKEKLDSEDLFIVKDVTEAEAELEKREKEKYEKKQAELKAIADHRASVVNDSITVLCCRELDCPAVPTTSLPLSQN